MTASWLRKPWLRRRGAGRETGERSETSPGRTADDEKLWYLQHINIFADMTEAEMRRLAERTTMRTYARGKVIAQPDDPLALVITVAATTIAWVAATFLTLRVEISSTGVATLQ